MGEKPGNLIREGLVELLCSIRAGKLDEIIRQELANGVPADKIRLEEHPNETRVLSDGKFVASIGPTFTNPPRQRPFD